ncbi:MAG: hypothetical protein JRI70_11495 [Deltaproteobacteria bacterium]|nr:hypothetical protein [Deltaproteobacteria bacterium]
MRFPQRIFFHGDKKAIDGVTAYVDVIVNDEDIFVGKDLITVFTEGVREVCEFTASSPKVVFGVALVALSIAETTEP